MKLNIKHDPECALNIKSEIKQEPMKSKHEPTCALNIKSEIKQEPKNMKHDPACALNIKSEIKQEPMKLKHDPECDLFKMHDFHLKRDDDAPRNIFHQEKMINIEPDDCDDREENSGIEKETVNSGKKMNKPTMFKRLL